MENPLLLIFLLLLLSCAEKVPFESILDKRKVYHLSGAIRKWFALESGYGVGFNSYGKSIFLSDCFRPELSFFKVLTIRSEKIAIIKYSFGGSALFQVAGYGNLGLDFNDNNHSDNAIVTIQNFLSSAV
tara:strand:- start:156 stop:542 length:387 start_codon:yes stop_codon:yes gene_type:complete